MGQWLPNWWPAVAIPAAIVGWALLTKEPPAAPAPPPQIVTIKELLTAYGANVIAARQTYEGHPLMMSGIVLSIDQGFGGKPIIEFDTGTDDQIAASLGEESMAAAAALKKGEAATVRCDKIAQVLGTLVLTRCTLLPPI